MYLNSNQKLIINELNLEKELLEIEKLQTEIELINQNEQNLTKLMTNSVTNSLSWQNSKQKSENDNQKMENLGIMEQKLKILKTKLSEKIQKNWQIYDQKTEIQKFCPYVQIKLCDGICGYKETLENYNLKIDQIKTILGGKIKRAKLFLEGKIIDAIDKENYPLAALWRDRIKYLEDLTIDQNVVLNSEEDLDLCTLVIQDSENGLILGSVFCQNIREGKVVNVNNYLLSGNSSGENKSEIAFSFWQRFLSTFVVSTTNLAPVVLQTFWNENKN